MVTRQLPSASKMPAPPMSITCTHCETAANSSLYESNDGATHVPQEV